MPSADRVLKSNPEIRIMKISKLKKRDAVIGNRGTRFVRHVCKKLSFGCN